MKVNSKIRILSATLAMILLFTGCGSTTETPNADMNTTENGNVSVEKEDTNTVTSPSDEDVTIEAEPTPEELELLEWQNYMMPDVDVALNVRVEPNVEAELAGKLRRGDRATVIEIGAEWTKIKSGDVEGYVSNEFCKFGADALAYAKETCPIVAVSTVDGLRIREQMNTDCLIVGRMDEGDKLVVDTEADTIDGWVAVILDDVTYYVSAEYVSVGWDIGTGITKAELDEIARQEEEARKKREEQLKQEAAEKLAADNALMCEVDELTLMAAIIYCEAGAEPYETQLAVGAVIMNRIASDRFPDNLYDVLSQKGQFTPYRTGRLAYALENSKATESCYQAAREALSGVDNTSFCLFFNDYDGSHEGIRYGGMVFWW